MEVVTSMQSPIQCDVVQNSCAKIPADIRRLWTKFIHWHIYLNDSPTQQISSAIIVETTPRSLLEIQLNCFPVLRALLQRFHCFFGAAFLLLPFRYLFRNIFSLLFAPELRGVDKHGGQPIGRPPREFPLSKWKWRRQRCAPRCGWGFLFRFSASAGCSPGRTLPPRVPAFRNR
jgi:hypothetical protein